MTSRLQLIVLAAAAVIVAVAVAVTLAQGSQASPLDSHLQSTAAQLQAQLTLPNAPYTNQGSFLNAFNLYQHNEQNRLQSVAPGLRREGRFAQVWVYENTTMPPVWRLLRSHGEPLITSGGSLVQEALHGKSTFTTIQQGNLQFRAYITPLSVPPFLHTNGTSGAIEVFQVTS
ncbi:MAG TPA: hypothetical protein VFB58_17395 [Chloroflexota bacterium]|nr:hypothetical protein [Chloroflexota bacterium]